MLIVALVFLLSFAFASTAFAAAELPMDLAKPILDALMSGDYTWAVAATLVMGVAALRVHGAKLWGPLGSGKAAGTMVVLGSFLGATLDALTGGEGLSWGLAGSALKIAMLSAGGVSLSKLLAPAWLRPLLDMLLGSDRVKYAEQAGQDAVDDNPSKGTGMDFTDVD